MQAWASTPGPTRQLSGRFGDVPASRPTSCPLRRPARGSGGSAVSGRDAQQEEGESRAAAAASDQKTTPDRTVKLPRHLDDAYHGGVTCRAQAVQRWAAPRAWLSCGCLAMPRRAPRQLPRARRTQSCLPLVRSDGCQSQGGRRSAFGGATARRQLLAQRAQPPGPALGDDRALHDGSARLLRRTVTPAAVVIGESGTHLRAHQLPSPPRSPRASTASLAHAKNYLPKGR